MQECSSCCTDITNNKMHGTLLDNTCLHIHIYSLGTRKKIADSNIISYIMFFSSLKYIIAVEFFGIQFLLLFKLWKKVVFFFQG